jgi:electron transport complex protein RnfE
MGKNRYMKEFTKGILRENPVLVLLLGLCPTLGVTSSAVNGMAMGLATMAVLVCSSTIVSAVKKAIPDKIRIPAYIMVIASLVTLVEMLMKAYVPAIYKVLGLFVPLIVVNCIILGRAESFASKNHVVLSIVDAVGIGIGFTLSLTILGGIREVLGNGSIFGLQLMPASVEPALLFILPPGAFLTLGCMIAFVNHHKSRQKVKSEAKLEEV